MTAVLADNRRAVIRAMPWVFVMIWSTGFIVARFGMPHAPPLTFLAMRFALSLACFAVWMQLARIAWPRERVQWLHLAVVGVLVQAGYLGGVWAAVKHGVGAGTIALVVGLQPVLTALWMSGRGAGNDDGGTRGVSARQWIGLVLGLAGLTLVVWHKLGGAELTHGNLALALLALLSITVGTLYQKHYVAPCDVRAASAVQLLAALAVSLPFALLETGPVVWHAQMIGALAWSVLVLTLGGSSLLYLLIQRGAATEVTSLMYLVPPCTAALAWLLFGEDFTWSMGLGMLLTGAGVALVTQRSPRVERAS
ncbi:MAG TPA: DMT family transporter [Burkholderiaceae bacterium]|nr:DMT family transporter [Burkholderiaceae bacterium]